MQTWLIFTLFIRYRPCQIRLSLKFNYFFSTSYCYLCASLVNIHLLGKEIECRQGLLFQPLDDDVLEN